MVNSKIIKNFSQFVLIFFLLFSCGKIFAEDSGQIININQNYQIAFTDLGNRVLNQGDIVKVSLNTDEFLYLQVLESSAILTKLGPSKAEGFQTNLNDFQRMAVGNEVVKVNQTQEKVDNSAANVSETDNTVKLSQLQVKKLEDALSLAKEEIKRLEQSNEESKAKLNELAAENQANGEESVQAKQAADKQILDQLKIHLDNMRKLIDENN